MPFVALEKNMGGIGTVGSSTFPLASEAHAASLASANVATAINTVEAAIKKADSYGLTQTDVVFVSGDPGYLVANTVADFLKNKGYGVTSWSSYDDHKRSEVILTIAW